ncbi:glycosyltransferase family 4 protein [Halolamina sediminis]|uniref:glycosyltransferase family 4 protein n=1 Tax=Halolamina sediminis TaxID=1480675 RepID=UPI0009AECCCB|nr:glycosyltransferase family 4 protein [Halolamina sediminis]
MAERALFLTPIFEPYVGGAAVHFDQLTRGLIENETISFFILISAYSPEAPIYEPRQNGIILRVLFSPNSIHRGWSKPKIIANYLIATIFSLASIFLFNTSIMHTHTRNYFSWAVRVAKAAGVSVVVDGRDLGAPSFPATGDVFVAISDNIYNKADDRDERLIRIPVGINPKTLSVNCQDVSTPAEPYFLFVGDITERKGVPELLDAYESDPRGRKLVLIGERVNADIDIERLDTISYLGPQPHKEVLCYIRAADIVFLPSKEEGLPRVVLESVFHETPVVCPPIVPEFHQHLPEMTLSAIDASEIQNTIDRILDEGLEPDEFPIKEHYVSNVVDEYSSLYKSLSSPPDT